MDKKLCITDENFTNIVKNYYTSSKRDDVVKIYGDIQDWDLSNVTYNYERVKPFISVEMNTTTLNKTIILAIKEQVNAQKRFRFDRNVKLPFHFKCGHINHCCLNTFDKNHDICIDCRIAKANIIKSEKMKILQGNKETRTQEIERRSINYIIDNINKDIIDIQKCPSEGCHSDLRIRFKNSNVDIWHQIQHKSSTTLIPEFNYKSEYENMLFLCHDVNNNILLLFKPYELVNSEINKIKYNKNGETGIRYKKNIIAIENITKELCKYIREYPNLGEPSVSINNNGNKNYILEQKYIKIRIAKCHFLDFKQFYGKCYDFLIDNVIRIQEKTRNSTYGDNSFSFDLMKKNGYNLLQPYEIGDNDFYWFNLAGTPYFYVIPEKILITDNKIIKNITLHKDILKPIYQNTYTTTWTRSYQFNYNTIENEINEIKRLQCLLKIE